MYRVIEGRGTGKTSRLMLLAKETGAVIVCKNPYAMKQKALAYGITGIEFIGYADILAAGYDYSKVLIDELEDFTKYVVSNKLIGYTLSNED